MLCSIHRGPTDSFSLEISPLLASWKVGIWYFPSIAKISLVPSKASLRGDWERLNDEWSTLKDKVDRPKRQYRKWGTCLIWDQCGFNLHHISPFSPTSSDSPPDIDPIISSEHGWMCLHPPENSIPRCASDVRGKRPHREWSLTQASVSLKQFSQQIYLLVTSLCKNLVVII